MKKMLIFITAVILVFAVITVIAKKEMKSEKTTSIEKINYYQNQITPEQLQQDLSNKKEKIIYYYQTTCLHCSRVSPIVIPMAKDMNIDMQVMNLGKYKQGWSMFQIKGTPTIVHYKDGKEINRILGEQSRETFKNWFENNK
ncbi:thioredoxin family protein [Bacillus sp. AFS018417]|uniref:thioredoxin family protein n=1 Tax=unclassified Bacillus (in: firmicutes) TaxID=185979 RepID=UPI000BF39CFC|nr:MULTISPECIES: thioredoxin family protein [unclassified Bacillus (in: firmicutes)]MCP1124102.1 thioredoxin family protein [Bacillus sp. 3103sda1]PEZ06891.1 thioredoxin family protein [Bacillus sp. AFS018417]